MTPLLVLKGRKISSPRVKPMYSDTELHNASQPAQMKRNQKFSGFEVEEGDRELLSRLSEEHRALLLADGSYKDKAEQLGIPLGTVRSRLHRARAILELLRHDADGQSTDQPAT
jgi:DNA-directed RNA polymerase specialized sigma24 family protein